MTHTSNGSAADSCSSATPTYVYPDANSDPLLGTLATKRRCAESSPLKLPQSSPTPS